MTRRLRLTHFRTHAELERLRQWLQDDLDQKLGEYNGNIPTTPKGNTVKGQLGELRDLAAMEAIGVSRGWVNKVVGVGYDIRGFKGSVAIQLESKNDKPNTTFSGPWINRQILLRFPKGEDSEVVARRIVRAVAIPGFRPYGHRAQRMKDLMDKRGIRVIPVDKQALTVKEALTLSKGVESQLRQILRDNAERDDIL